MPEALAVSDTGIERDARAGKIVMGACVDHARTRSVGFRLALFEVVLICFGESCPRALLMSVSKTTFVSMSGGY